MRIIRWSLAKGLSRAGGRLAAAASAAALAASLVGALLVIATFAAAGATVPAASAQTPQADRTRMQADIDAVNGRIRNVEAREARAARVKGYLESLANDDSTVVVRARDFNGWVPMPPAKLEEALISVAFASLASGGEIGDPLAPLAKIVEESDRHKQSIRTNELPSLDRRIAELARQRGELERERERLLAAFSRPDRLGPAPPAPAPRDVDLWGTWKPAGGGPDVVTIRGDRSGYTLSGTNGQYKHEGTITGDGVKYEGDLVDQPGFCCGREGHVWIEVVDANTYRAKSVWWRTGQSTRERPELTYGWANFTRSTK